ncbi:hypothetical protein LPB138_04990 [Urechidicola croceus]|uniref:Tetratricopeptide repeat protein n=2 Tax=Urechidicola croceus TaxID=1850246 RepID=A0A1D8PBP5_9FLAO|nr:hypothetical protein LPB138_04990 [Urechidicola croceus]
MFKKQLIMLSASLLISVAAFSQKKELKTVEKAVKNGDFTTALAAITQVEGLIANADLKSKAKFYFLKGQALFGKGTNEANTDKAIEAFNTLMQLEKDGSGTKYSTEAKSILDQIVTKISDRAREEFADAQANADVDGYKKASDSFFKVYELSPSDTTSLFSASYLGYFGQNYEKSLEGFEKLLELGFTGVTTIHKATSKVNGEPKYFGSAKEMDTQVKLGVYENPTTEVTKSKVSDIAKYMAFDYVGLGKNDEALAAIATARENNPDDYDLIISEANLYYKLGDNDKFIEKLEEAISLNPDNAELHYNVGTLSMEANDLDKAKKHLSKAVELDPTHADAYNNLGNLVLKKLKAVEEEMNANAMNFAKYDQIKVEKFLPILNEAMPYLEKAYELKPSEFTKKQLNSLYENLGLDKKIE